MKKALSFLLRAMTNTPYRTIGRILRADHALVFRWARAFEENPRETGAPGTLKEMEFDEMRHYIGTKKIFGSSKPLIVAHGELWPGCPAIVILQHPGDGSLIPSSRSR
jgi:hypothetical protein